MKSPFPGMDPFIEAFTWGNFHHTLITDICRTLSASLPRGYVATTEVRSYIALVEDEDKVERHFIPDVKITEPREQEAEPDAPDAAVATLDQEPVEMRAEIEEEFAEAFIDIYELRPERRLVTSIEILSPANKRPGSGSWSQYLRKRQALLMGEANLVEIDLLRCGTRMPMREKWTRSPYTLLVARKEQSLDDLKRQAPRCHVWPAHFDRPLPKIPVPLDKPHADLTLELQPLIDAIYVQMRYAEQIDYGKPLDPPLSAKEAAWLRKRLRPTPKAGPKPKRKSKR
jgi:hypothetical protein